MFGTKISGKAGKGSEMHLLPTVVHVQFAFYTPLIYLKLSNKNGTGEAQICSTQQLPGQMCSV